MSRLTDEELEAIRKRAEAATPGPWSYQYAIGIEVVSDKATVVADDDGVVRYPDARFIAESREDIPKLLAEIDRLKAELSFTRSYDKASEELAHKYLSGVDRHD